MEPNKNLTLGSLFDGSGGFPLGGALAGITPVWASEIEPFPIRVTTRRFPTVKHYGDISRMDGAKIEPVDIITFGSPCTDLSIAGRRAGLDGERSVLFYEAIRIIKEMRCATNGRYPRWACWENVPGAFSSNNGRDFKAVLDALIGVVEEETSVPMPEKDCWPYADCYMGDGWSLAYRTLDAQHWGVPQRRRRIYLVADFAGQCAGKVLFESEGLSGYSAESFYAWQGAARDTAAGLGATGFDGGKGGLTGDVNVTPGANRGMSIDKGGIVLNDQGGERMDVTNEVTSTLRAEAHHPPCVLDPQQEVAISVENHPTDGRVKLRAEDTAQTLTSRMGTGGMNVPLVLKIRCGCEGGGKGPLIQEDKSATLSCNNDQTVFVPFCKGTRPHSAQEGQEWKEEKVANTLNTHDVGETRCSELAVRAFGIGSVASKGMLSDNPRAGIYEAQTARTLDQSGGSPSCNQGGIAVVEKPTYAATTGHFMQFAEEQSPTLTARDFKDPTVVNRGYSVRRLTPTECARLQGFPDWWCAGLDTPKPTEEDIAFWGEVWETHRRVVGGAVKPKSRSQLIKWLNAPHSDAAEYKMWGNGVALPCVFFVLSGIVWCEQIQAQ